MATADRVLMLKLLGDTGSIDKSLRKTEGRLKSMGRSAASWGKAFTAGLVIEGIDKVTDALGDAWDGFREGERAAGQLGTTWGNLGKDGDELAGVIDQISDSTLKLGTDDTEAINAFNEALKTTGGDSKKAMDRLRIAQDLVANGSAPNLASALGIIRGAAKGSSRVVDKFGLAADTAGGRVKELGRKVKGAGKRAADLDPLGVFFNAMNEDLEGIVGSLASGDLDGALQSIADIGTHLSETWDKVGPGVTEVLDKLSGGAFSTVVGLFQDLGEKFGPKVAAALDATSAAWEALLPHLQNALTFIQPVVDLLSGSLAGGLAFVLDSVEVALQTVTDLLKGDFTGAFSTVMDGIGTLATDLDTFFVGLPGKIATWAVEIVTEASLLGQGIFDGIVAWAHTALNVDLLGFFVGIPAKLTEWAVAITGAAGDIGKGILGGVMDFVSKLPGRVLGVFQAMASGIVAVWNSLGKFGPGGFTFAEAFQFEVLGQSFGWPKLAIEWGGGDLIPNIGGGGGGRNQLGLPMAEGGIVKKRPGGMLARIGEGAHDEAVIPLDGRGMGGGSTYNIVVNVAPGGDLVAAGKMMVQAIQSYERRSGRAWRAA